MWIQDYIKLNALVYCRQTVNKGAERSQDRPETATNCRNVCYQAVMPTVWHEIVYLIAESKRYQGQHPEGPDSDRGPPIV